MARATRTKLASLSDVTGNPLKQSFVHSGAEYLFLDKQLFYHILKHLPAGLGVDVGAAIGVATRQILNSSPDSRVIAFEPFPANLELFRKELGEDPRITLVPKAVAEKKGIGKLYVRAVAARTDGAWAERQGKYSGIGKLVNADHEHAASSIDVEICTLDDEVSEPVRLLKIDVQGGELNVLRGAERLLSNGRIDLIFMEFGGGAPYRDLLPYLANHGFFFFDTACRLVPKKSEPDPGIWKVFGSHVSSTGSPRRRAWPIDCPREIEGYWQFLSSQSKIVGNAFNDIVAVSSAFADSLLAAARANAEQTVNPK